MLLLPCLCPPGAGGRTGDKCSVERWETFLAGGNQGGLLRGSVLELCSVKSIGFRYTEIGLFQMEENCRSSSRRWKNEKESIIRFR